MNLFFQKLEHLRVKHIVWTIIILGIVLYSKSFLNGFVGDDLGYINHPYIQQFKLLEFFKSSSADLGGTSPITGQFFRPLMLVVLSAIYALFGSNAFFYHVPQVALHVTNVILIFFLLRKFLSKNIAFVLSLIFLVHPINVETVAYVSDFQDVMFVLFGLLAMIALLYQKFGKYNIYVILLLLFLSLLSKETGILFIVTTYLYMTFILRRSFFNSLMLLTIPIAAYIFLRFYVAGVYFGKISSSLFGSMTLSERLAQIPSLVFYYAKTLLFPSQLAIAQTWVDCPSSLFTYTFASVAILIVTIVGWQIIRKRSNNYLLIHSVWLLLGIAFLLQIMPLEMTVADRWFYFPFIGLLGIIGIFISKIQNKNILKSIFVVGLCLIAFLSIRTFIRLSDWKSPISLYEHDSQITNSYLLEDSLGYEYMQEDSLDRAYPHLKKSVGIFPTTNNTNTLGVYYFKKNDNRNAIIWLSKSVALGDNFLSYSNLSRILLTEKNYKEAEKVLVDATKKFPKNDVFWYLLAICYYKQNNLTSSREAAENAYQISASPQNYYVVSQLRAGLPLKIND